MQVPKCDMVILGLKKNFGYYERDRLEGITLLNSLLFFFTERLYLFIFREKGREREREGKKHH